MLGFFGCTQSGDGPLQPGNRAVGYGFYRGALLAEGRRVHPASDTISLRLDSLWILEDCALHDLRLDSMVVDTTMALAVVVELQSPGKVNCATTQIRDTVLRIAPRDFWKDLRWIQVEGVRPRTGQIDAEGQVVYGTIIHDSIAVRHGILQDTTLVFTLDSLARIPRSFPQVYGKGSMRLVYYPDTVRIRNFTLRLRWEQCAGQTVQCNQVADTAKVLAAFSGDTVLAPVRTRCLPEAGQSVAPNFCPRNIWQRDTLKAEEFLPKQDTLWSGSAYWVERIAACATINLFSASNVGQLMTVRRELFVPDALETECFGVDRGTRLAWDILRQRELHSGPLLDSLFGVAGI